MGPCMDDRLWHRRARATVVEEVEEAPVEIVSYQPHAVTCPSASTVLYEYLLWRTANPVAAW